jgi:hypothetical protein
MQNRSRPPALSVILPTTDDFSTVRLTVKALREQTARSRIELVIVSPVEDPGVITDEVVGFARVTIVNAGPLEMSNVARVAGIRAASAPIVALAEDHSFPDPDWADALIAAHEAGWAVVGPAVVNANPRSMVSWSNLLLEYSPWLEGTARGTMDDLPGHNSAYRRDLLLAFGDRLEELFEVEAVIQRELRGAGHRMLLEPAARTNHLNFSKVSSSLKLRFHAGRSFAGHRTMGWSAAKRIAYIAGAPLIPVIRFRRILGLLQHSKTYSRLLPRVIPMLCVALAVDGFGELVGYISGPGDAPRALGAIEFDRIRFLDDADALDLRRRTEEVRADLEAGDCVQALTG